MRPPSPAQPLCAELPPGGPGPRLLPDAGDRPLLTVEAVRALERRFNLPHQPDALMQRAGRGLARLATALAPHAPLVVVECGPGHNGGDGLVAAAILARQGRAVRVALAFDAGDASTRAGLAPAVALALREAHAAGCVFAVDSDPAPPDGLCIDALLGIGASRPPEGAILAGVRRLRAHRGPVLSVDVPTGLQADTGRLLGESVVAHDTLTFIAGKPGLFTAAGRDHAGRVWLDDLGLDDAVQTAALATAQVLRLGGWAAQPRQRRHVDHKGSLGDVVVVGGASGMEGALELAAAAAHAAGAGRVWCLPLSGQADRSGPRRSEWMRMPGLALRDPATLSGRTVVAGCGGGTDVAAALPPVLRDAARLVLDADGLNAVSADATLRRALVRRGLRGGPTVITPHPLEAARLLGCTTAEVQNDRVAASRSLAMSLGVQVVLKGSGSLLTGPGPSGLDTWINPTGGPALATPGSGDVLAGWIGGLWSGVDPDALAWACQEACRLHGAVAQGVEAGPLRAADLVEWMWLRRAGQGRTGNHST